MSAVEKLLENNLLTLAVIGGAVYVIFFTELGEAFRCLLNPLTCAKKPFEAADELAQKTLQPLEDLVRHDVVEMKGKMSSAPGPTNAISFDGKLKF